MASRLRGGARMGASIYDMARAIPSPKGMPVSVCRPSQAAIPPDSSRRSAGSLDLTSIRIAAPPGAIADRHSKQAHAPTQVSINDRAWLSRWLQACRVHIARRHQHELRRRAAGSHASSAGDRYACIHSQLAEGPILPDAAECDAHMLIKRRFSAERRSGNVESNYAGRTQRRVEHSQGTAAASRSAGRRGLDRSAGCDVPRGHRHRARRAAGKTLRVPQCSA